MPSMAPYLALQLGRELIPTGENSNCWVNFIRCFIFVGFDELQQLHNIQLAKILALLPYV